MKPTCILHVGMPKTGTTSIQVSFARGLRDPAFHYINPGHSQSAMFLEALFSERPEEFWQFRLRKYSRTRLRWMRWEYGRRFQGILERARELPLTPILSSERWWVVPPSDLERLADFLHRRGFRAHVVAYLRPLKSWIESCFQEESKGHGLPADCFPKVWDTPETRCYRCVGRLAEYERIFGRENLTVRPFVRRLLRDGCAVRDFCDLLGIGFDPDRIVRTNESVSLEAVKFLHAYGRFGPAAEVPLLYLPGRWQLLERLERLRGTPFRFHSEVVDPIQEILDWETRTVAERYGVDISEDVRSADGGPCVREPADMYRFSEEALDWLAAETGSKPMVAREGEAVAREVALRVERLRSRLVWRRRLTIVSRAFRAARRRLRPTR